MSRKPIWLLVRCGGAERPHPVTDALTCYGRSSAVSVAPPIDASTDEILSGLRLSLLIQTVDLSEPPSAEVISTRHASNSPAGTVTFSLPATLSCSSFGLRFCRSKLRYVVV